MAKEKKENLTILPTSSKKDQEHIDPYFYYLDYATGGLLPSSYAFGGNLSSSGSDENTMKQTEGTTDNVWQGVRTGVAAVNPIAGIIHAAAGLGESAMANVDPDKTRGANMSRATWDPFSAQMGVWGNKDANIGERVLAGLVPLSAGLINTKYDKKHAAENMRNNLPPAEDKIEEFQNTMYGDGGSLPPKKDTLKEYYDTLNKYPIIDPLNTKDANDVKNYIGKDIAPKLKEYQKQLNIALRNKYNLAADAPITKEYLTAEEANKAVNGKYDDYMTNFKAYQDYRKKTPVMPERKVEGTVTEDETIYGQRHVNLFQPYEVKKGKGGFLPEIFANGGDMDIVDINGPKHTEGGIPMGKGAEVEGGEVKVDNYIFSDQLKYSGSKTFADQAKTIRKRFEERKSDGPAMKTQLVQLEQLKSLNEAARVEKEKQDAYTKDLLMADAKAYGGYIKVGKSGKMEIDPSMRKTLTKTAKARGMSTLDYATKLFSYGGELKKMYAYGGEDDPDYMDFKFTPMDEVEDPSLAPMKLKATTSPEKSQDGFKFGNEEIALGSSLLPAMQNLAYSLKKPEQTKFERVDPDLISLAAERDLAGKETSRARTIARENIRGNSNNSGQVLSNLAAANSSLTENLMDKYTQSFMAETNANTQIKNRANEMNTTIGNQEIVANEQNRAMAKSLGNSALADIGTNTQGYMRDKKLSSENARQNERTMQIINSMFPGYHWQEDPERDNQLMIAFKNS